jgi:hypothetical protein
MRRHCRSELGVFEVNIEELRKLLSKDFVTVKEVADALGMARSTIGLKIKRGQLDAVDTNPGGELPM